MKRIVTYDVKQGNDYSAWYDYVEKNRRIERLRNLHMN